MPKKSALRFQDVQEAVDWATNPPPDQAAIRQGIGMAMMRFTCSRPNYGIREDYLEGVRLFEKAAAKANDLAFEQEVQLLNLRENTVPPDRQRIRELAQELVCLAQRCHAWGPDESTGVDLDSFLRMIPPLDEQEETEQANDDLQGLSARDRFVARAAAAWKQTGISRLDLLLVPQGRSTPFPTWWASDHQRMRTTAINLRRVASKLQVFADQARRRSGGRPPDGNRVRLIADARSLGVSVPALSFLMAAFAVQPSWPSSAAIPPGIRAMRHGGRPSGPLSKAERAWLETSQKKWFGVLTDAAKEHGRKRKATAQHRLVG